MQPLVNKVRALAEETKYCWGEWSVCVSSYNGEWNDWLIQVKAACREYSGILRGLCEMFTSLGIDYYAEGIVVELIQVWRETLTASKQEGVDDD